MAKSLVDKIIYLITKKPEHYVEVKNPPRTPREKLARPQDARQMQYNAWSKKFQVFSGSYLPYRRKELLKQGWRCENSNPPFNETYVRRSTGQTVLYHAKQTVNGETKSTHYHWKNPAADSLPKTQKKENYYFDKFGDICMRGSPESHITPHRTRRKK